MEKFLQFLVAFQSRASVAKNDRGATATEYAILVAVIALVLATGAILFGSALSSFFSSLANDVSTGSW